MIREGVEQNRNRVLIALPAMESCNAASSDSAITRIYSTKEISMKISRFPEEIYASDEFGDRLYAEPSRFQKEVQACIDVGFDEDFDPDYVVWKLVEGSEGIYERTASYTADGKWHHINLKKKFLRDGDYWMEDKDYSMED
jgi:hypothetical protein